MLPLLPKAPALHNYYTWETKKTYVKSAAMIENNSWVKSWLVFLNVISILCSLYWSVFHFTKEDDGTFHSSTVATQKFFPWMSRQFFSLNVSRNWCPSSNSDFWMKISRFSNKNSTEPHIARSACRPAWSILKRDESFPWERSNPTRAFSRRLPATSKQDTSRSTK